VVAEERRVRLLRRLIGGDAELGTRRLCEGSAEITDMSGAGIMLMSADLPRGSLCTTDAVSSLIEELQFTLGEGPCVDAFREDRPVSEPDLIHPATPRWFGFAPPAIEAGALAVFGFPLQVGAIRLGALNLYRDRPGRLSDEQHADGLVLADIAAAAILVLQANAPSGQLAAELEAGADFQYVVHQASGMIAAQLEVSVGQALIRLRAHAFAADRRLPEVAEDVVARRLRFDPRRDGDDEAS
jgi:hypothetical protein